MKKTKRWTALFGLLSAVPFLSGEMPVTYSCLTDSDTAQETITPVTNETALVSDEKGLRVRNTGDCPCFVRVLLKEEAGNTVLFTAADGRGCSLAELEKSLPQGWAKKESDPYLYYTGVLEKGTETSSLFLSADAADGSGLEVFEESVQAVRLNGADAGGYLEVWGDFSDE